MGKEVHGRDQELRQAIGAQLREARFAQLLTVDEVARRLQVNRTMVHFWEQGRSFPTPEHLIQLLRLYGVSADVVLGLATGKRRRWWQVWK